MIVFLSAGYGHAKQPATIDLNAIRLCFQVFLEGQQRGRFTEPLQPVVSDVIYDKKAMSDLVICKLSDVTAPVAGGREIILLCEKVAKEDIAVRFYEEQHGNIVWEEYGEFQHTNVHKQVAICFRTPRYRTLDVEHHVMVSLFGIPRLSTRQLISISCPYPGEHTTEEAIGRCYQ